VKFCETVAQFASSCDSPAQVLLVLHSGGNLEPTPTTLQMHEAYKNARDQNRTKNITSSTEKKDPLPDITSVAGVETI
jgi:hypothetical protein